MAATLDDGMNSLSVDVSGWQYAERHDEFDEWLQIELTVSTPGGEWSASEPALLASELATLCAWLEGWLAASPGWAAERNDVPRTVELVGRAACISFVEPVLSLAVLPTALDAEPSAQFTLLAFFGLEFRPPWCPAPDDARARPFVVPLLVSRTQLQAFHDRLSELAQRFPPQLGTPGGPV